MVIEIAGPLTRTFFRETQGRTEEVRTRTDGDPLGSVMRCLGEGTKKLGCEIQDLLKHAQWMKLRSPEMIAEALVRKTGARVG
jgi:hypothetical protein